MSYILHMNKITLTIIFFLSSFYVTAGEDILNYLSTEDKVILYADGELSRYFFDKEKPDYLFDSRHKTVVLNDLSKLKITIGVESLYLLKYSEISGKKILNILDIYNTLLSVKTMKGIEYYSQSRKKMRTLFTESYGLAELENQEQVDDPVVSTIPSFFSRYILQTDKTFGENKYKANYYYDGRTIWVNMVNIAKMSYSFIPMLKPEKMSINLLITPVDGGLLFYGLTAAETSSFLGLEKAKKESFYNRLKAMYNWFKYQLRVNVQE
jgi:hypothetical protein